MQPQFRTNIFQCHRSPPLAEKRIFYSVGQISYEVGLISNLALISIGKDKLTDNSSQKKLMIHVLETETKTLELPGRSATPINISLKNS